MAKDPYYEIDVIRDRKGNIKEKRVKRGPPPGISKEDAEIFMSVKKYAYRLNNWWSVGGVRVGWSAIIGIVPG
jgi:hypothetical protein